MQSTIEPRTTFSTIQPTFQHPDPLRTAKPVAIFIQVVAEKTTGKQNKRAGLQDRTKTGTLKKWQAVVTMKLSR
jgi:hypothetical protein